MVEMRLEPIEQEPKVVTRCRICGEEIHEREEYILFHGIVLCGGCDCLEEAIKRVCTLSDYREYAKAHYEDFCVWAKERILEAMQKGKPLNESLFFDYAFSDFYHFSNWYYEEVDSGEERTA